MTTIEHLRRIVAEVEETEKANTRNAATDYAARVFIRDHGASLLQAMTSHTPAGDDLVARLRDVLEAIQYGSRNCIKEHGQKTVNELAGVGLSYLEALTSQQHTEPVAGEVEVVGYLFRLRYGPDHWSHQLMFSNVLPKDGDHKDTTALVTKSSYDALAAAKDARLRYVQELADDDRDEATARIQALERQRDALEAYRLAAEDHLQRNSQGSLNKLNRAREALKSHE